MRKVKIVAWLLVFLVVLTAIIISNWDSIMVQYAWFRAKPEHVIRNQVSGLNPTDIAYIELKAPYMYKQVHNRAVIAKMLSGLQNAVVPDPLIKNRVDIVILYLKSGNQLGPYMFSIEREVDSFSPEFVYGLRQLGIKVPE
jgi:hypothetical protein